MTVKKVIPDLSEMTIWAVEARYPADMPEILESDAQRAIRVADKLIRLIQDDVAEHFKPATDAH